MSIMQRLSPPKYLKYTKRIFNLQQNPIHATGVKFVEEPKLEIKKESRGHKDDPIMVASYSKKCIVGCRCHDKVPTIKWFFLEEGPSQVCDCGHHFQLDKVKRDTWIPDHARIMSIDETLTDPRVVRKEIPFIYPKKNKEPVKIS